MPAGVGCICAAALTIRCSTPSRKARIAASASRIPPLSWTTTSKSSGSRKAGKAELASAPEVGPAIGPFRAAAARDAATVFDPGGPASSTRLGFKIIRPVMDSSVRQPLKAWSLKSV